MGEPELNFMMSTITIELPDEVFASMRCDPGQMAQEIRFATAMVWYEQGKISQEVAANLAGLDRVDFLLELARWVAILSRLILLILTGNWRVAKYRVATPLKK
jgi:hypothetical protein